MTRGNKLAAAGLVLVLLVLLNVAAALLPGKLDWTADDLYSITPGTRKILGAIKEPITVEFFFSESREGIPVVAKNYAARVREMLRQYARASGGQITLKVIDPKPDTPDEERATRLGLSPRNLPSGERVFLGLTAVQADVRQSIEFLDPARERFLEYDLSQLIYAVQRFDKPKLGLLSSLPLAPRGANPFSPQGGQPGAAIYGEWERTYEIVTIEANAQDLPDGLAALALIHPQNLTPQLEFALDQFILSGRPVFLALDPSSRFFRAQSQQQMMFGGPPPNVTSSLPRLFSAYGITFETDSVVGDRDAAMLVPGPDRRPIAYPAAMTLKEDSIRTDSPITSQIKNVLFVDAGALSLVEGSKLELTPLIQTGPRGGRIPAISLQFGGPEEAAKTLQPSDRPLTVAGLIRGTLPTAFPDGRPAADATAPAPASAPPPLKESAQPANLLIVTDSDWLLDDYTLDARFRQMGILVAGNDNLAFAANALDTFAGSTDLIALRGKDTSNRPFTVVRDMERAAQERYQSELDALEKRLAEVQAELTKLQSQQTEQRVLVITPEVESKIAAFREQEAEMTAQRREIRRRLREDIEELKTQVILINLAAMPLTVVGFGLWFFWQRSRQRSVRAAAGPASRPTSA